MAAKTTGAEFKRFYNDPQFWPEGAWHEEDVITFDGVEPEGIDVDKISDTAKVVIVSGVVFLSQDDREGVALDSYFRRWLKTQATRQLIVEVDVSKMDAVLAAVKAAGGKVL